MIVIKSIGEIKPEEFDHVFGIVRYPKKMASLKGVKIIPALAPTSDLFDICQELKKTDDWGSLAFKEIYVPRFLRDFRKNSDAKDFLRKLYRNEHSDNPKKIALVCYCPNEKLCHRSIIAGLLQGLGIKVETSLGLDYSKYYKIYKEEEKR